MYNYPQVGLNYRSARWAGITDGGGGGGGTKSIHPFQKQAAGRAGGPRETTHNSRKKRRQAGSQKIKDKEDKTVAGGEGESGPR